jgi:phenylalanyl-tRNA synthetase beta chain
MAKKLTGTVSQVIGPVIDVTSKENLPTRATITLRRSKLDRLIGHHIDDAQVTDILQRLGCEVTVGEGEWQEEERVKVD